MRLTTRCFVLQILVALGYLLAMPINQGWYNNLWVELRQASSRYLELEVRLVCQFSFQHMRESRGVA